MCDYAALKGETVTEGHLRYCAERGHAVHQIDGMVQDDCPRCGMNLASEDLAGRDRNYLMQTLAKYGVPYAVSANILITHYYTGFDSGYTAGQNT